MANLIEHLWSRASSKTGIDGSTLAASLDRAGTAQTRTARVNVQAISSLRQDAVIKISSLRDYENNDKTPDQ